MRIALLTTTYPPGNTEGIARQRQALAQALVRGGHSVTVVTLGPAASRRVEAGVEVAEVPVAHANISASTQPALDPALAKSQALYEGLRALAAEQPFDVVDVPLWAGQALVTLLYHPGTVVLWLQTSLADLQNIDGQPKGAGDRAQRALELLCLQRAQAALADSVTARDVVRNGGLPAQVLCGVARLGLPAEPEPGWRPEDGQPLNVLVVGRLERRKGTPLLMDQLPLWLKRRPEARVIFAGRDNSAHDGWLQQHGLDYASYFRQQHPDAAEQVTFAGYVSEERLRACYAQAALVLVASTYESFGLVFLEAMRAGRPVVAFDIGAAREIFPRGERDGALLAAAGDGQALAAAIDRLADDANLRQAIGQSGRRRFLSAFTADAMAHATLAFYQQARLRPVPRPRHKLQIFQVMEALDAGDAVSSITRRTAGFLGKLGQSNLILARDAHPDFRAEVRLLDEAHIPHDAGLIFHYWGYNKSTWLLQAVRGPKAVYYHNITPPDYFAPQSEAYRATTQGRAQLEQIAGAFDLVIGDSAYNLRDFAQYLKTPKPAGVIYPVVEAAEIQSAVCDEAYQSALQPAGEVNFLFVGRLARNKRQDRLMQVFDYYYREINQHARLWLVGNRDSDPAYTTELERLRAQLVSGERIQLTGKLPQARVTAHYRSANIFLSASEHEGFCVPLVEAMAQNIPVLALAAAAVPETLGSSGLLVHDWDTARVAELAHIALSDLAIRERILVGQRENLARFTATAAIERLAAVVDWMQGGQLDARWMEWLTPAANPVLLPAQAALVR